MVRRVGYINFPHLMQIALLRDYLELVHMNSPHAKKSPNNSNDHRHVDKSSVQPNLNIRSKIFELSSILDVAKVNLYEFLTKYSREMVSLKKDQCHF